MLQTPQVVVIDDDKDHLAGLVEGLNGHGIACLPIHLSDDAVQIPPCPHLRVLFIDLHLIAGNSADEQHFATIGGLIENDLKPSGLYFIVLWTRYPKEAKELYHFLQQRLEGVTKPFVVEALDKANHVNRKNKVKDIKKLFESIQEIIDGQPQIGALLDWENQILEATADTLSSIVDLAVSNQNGDNLGEEVGRLLTNLACEAVGKKHVNQDQFRAVNEALLPILADRIATIQSNANLDLWRTAVKTSPRRQLSVEESAKLNRLLHIASPSTTEDSVPERGAVISLPSDISSTFKETFDLTPKEAAHNQFWCQDFEEDNSQFRWVLVQSQTACDYAQKRPGPLPFYLGLCLPLSKVREEETPDALWISPHFEINGVICTLHVHARFQVSLSSTYTTMTLFRLREQILNSLIYSLHSHSARPGRIQFRIPESIPE